MNETSKTGALRAAYIGAITLAAAMVGGEALAHAGAAHAAISGTTRVAPEHVTLTARPAAQRGPDGKMHDVYTNTTIRATVGQQVIVTVYNYDNARHSFTAPALHINQIMPGTKHEGTPTRTTFTFTVTRAGTYHWLCTMPCDDWSMARNGFMAGTITITRA